MGAAAHPWGVVPLPALLAVCLLLGACDGVAAPATRAVVLSANFSACGPCASAEVVLLRGEPPTCALARSTVALPAKQAGPQLAAPGEPVTVAVWAACSAGTPPTPPDPNAACAEAAQVCTGQLPGSNTGVLDPSLLAPIYQSLCRSQDQSPLQQCCAALMPCLDNNPSATCAQEIEQCAKLLNVPYVPGQIDLAQIKQLVQSYCAPNSAATAECCAALGRCVNGTPGAPPPASACAACRVLQRVDTTASQTLTLAVERAQSCERPAVLDLPDC